MLWIFPLIDEGLPQWVIEMVAGGFFSWLPYIWCVLPQWAFQFGINYLWEWEVEEPLWMVDVIDYYHGSGHLDGCHTCKLHVGSIIAYPFNKISLTLNQNKICLCY